MFRTRWLFNRATISAVLNLYWDLVSFIDGLRITERAVSTAEKLYQDNQNQAKLGALATIEVTRAAAALSAAKGDLLIAQTNVSQQETVLKNALSRTGVETSDVQRVMDGDLDTFVNGWLRAGCPTKRMSGVKDEEE